MSKEKVEVKVIMDNRSESIYIIKTILPKERMIIVAKDGKSINVKLRGKQCNLRESFSKLIILDEEELNNRSSYIWDKDLLKHQLKLIKNKIK